MLNIRSIYAPSPQTCRCKVSHCFNLMAWRFKYLYKYSTVIFFLFISSHSLQNDETVTLVSIICLVSSQLILTVLICAKLAWIDMTIVYCVLEQIVTFPFRLSDTLDIFLSNRPNLVNWCTPMPCLSDHDATAVAKLETHVKRKIYRWKKTVKKRWSHNSMNKKN